MDGEGRGDNVLGVWIDLIGIKEKRATLKNKFPSYLDKFHDILLDSIYGKRMLRRLFHVEGFSGKEDPMHRLLQTYVSNRKMIIFGDTIYLEICEVKWLSSDVLFWLRDLCEDCGEEYPLAIYICVGEVFPYSQRIQELGKKICVVAQLST